MTIRLGTAEIKKIISAYLEQNLNCKVTDSEAAHHGNNKNGDDYVKYGFISIDFECMPKTDIIPNNNILEDRKLDPDL